MEMKDMILIISMNLKHSIVHCKQTYFTNQIFFD